MEQTDKISPKKKIDFLTIAIGLEFVGVMFAVGAIIAKVNNNIPLSLTLLGVGIFLATPGIVYLIRYLVNIAMGRDKKNNPTNVAEIATKPTALLITPVVEEVRSSMMTIPEVKNDIKIEDDDDEPTTIILSKMPGVPEPMPDHVTDEELEYLYSSYAEEHEVAALVDELTPKAITQIENVVNEELLSVRNKEIEDAETVLDESIKQMDTLPETLRETVGDIIDTAIVGPDMVLDMPIENEPAIVQQPSAPVVVKKAMTPEILALKVASAEAKRNLFIKQNLDRYLKNYFIEVAACFLMNRDEYKDTFGIAPYNKIAITKSDVPGLPNTVTFSMSNTMGKLYKFCAYLIDAERFLTHEELYKSFVALLQSGTSLIRISEQLFAAYKKLYKKHFVNKLTNKENFDNMLVLASHSYIIDNNSFRDVFNRVPFSVPAGLTDENIVSYLTREDIEERFASAFPNYADIGFTNVWTAMYICFINSIKQNLTCEQLSNAILKDAKRITKMLMRVAKRQSKAKLRAKSA